MTFEEFEKATVLELRNEARRCFEQHSLAQETRSTASEAFLSQAQFYLSEIERRRGDRVALRDLILEIVVIILIGGEIILAISHGRNEDLATNRQIAVLQSLQTASQATATTLSGLLDVTRQMGGNAKATSDALSELKTTTVTMNRGVQDQLTLLYDPSVTLGYDLGQKRLTLTNNGRTNIEIVSVLLNNLPWPVKGKRLVAPGALYYIAIDVNNMQKLVPKDVVKSFPVEVMLVNAKARSFRMLCNIDCHWEAEKLVIHTQNLSIRPE